MDAVLLKLQDAFRTLTGAEMDGLLVSTLLFLFLAVVLFILYWSRRNADPDSDPASGSAGGPAATTVRAPSVFSAAPAHVPGGELLERGTATAVAAPGMSSGRQAFLKSLDSVERIVALFYLALSYVLLVAATAVMGWLYFGYPHNASRDFLLFYGGAVYIVVALGLIAKIVATRRRLRGRSEPGLLQLLYPRMTVSVESAPEVGFLDAAALERARQHLDRGGTLDEACGLLDPRYQQMPGWSKTVFRKVVEMSLTRRT